MKRERLFLKVWLLTQAYVEKGKGKQLILSEKGHSEDNEVSYLFASNAFNELEKEGLIEDYLSSEKMSPGLMVLLTEKGEEIALELLRALPARFNERLMENFLKEDTNFSKEILGWESKVRYVLSKSLFERKGC